MGNKLASSHLTSSHLHLPSAQTAARSLSHGTNPLGERRQRWCGWGGGLGGRMNLTPPPPSTPPPWDGLQCWTHAAWVQPLLSYINYTDLLVASRVLLNTAGWGLTSYSYTLTYSMYSCLHYKMQFNLMKNHFNIPIDTSETSAVENTMDVPALYL